MKEKIMLLSLLWIACSCLNAQIVETLDTNEPKSCDDLFVDEDGAIYTGKGGLSNKTNLGKILPDGSCTDVAEGMRGPISIVKGENGLFYVTNYDDNTIKTYNPETEAVLTVASGLDGPAGIAIDSTGIVYATNWGAWPTYNGHEVHRLLPDGTLEVLVDSPLFSRLQGIAIDDEGWLYVANTQDGRIFKINTETAQMETLVTIGQGILNMEYHDGYIYMASPPSSRILRMNLEGEWSSFAGSGIPGWIDGPADVARFNTPTGVGFSSSGDTLYIADAPSRIRRIIMNTPTSVFSPAFDKYSISVYPNPASEILQIDLSTQDYEGGEITLIDVMGKTILQEVVIQKTSTIDISTIPAGQYFVVFTKGDISTAVRLAVH